MIDFRLEIPQRKMRRIEQHRASFVVAKFILVNLLMFAEVKTIHALPLNASSGVQEKESQLSWDISTDNVAAYSLIPLLDLESLMEESAETGSNSSRRRRSTKLNNIVFEMVSSSKRRSFPYQGAVRIGNFCSGTLISESHVLSAAHCVHDGRAYRYKLSKIRVGKRILFFYLAIMMI